MLRRDGIIGHPNCERRRSYWLERVFSFVRLLQKYFSSRRFFLSQGTQLSFILASKKPLLRDGWLLRGTRKRRVPDTPVMSGRENLWRILGSFPSIRRRKGWFIHLVPICSSFLYHCDQGTPQLALFFHVCSAIYPVTSLQLFLPCG